MSLIAKKAPKSNNAPLLEPDNYPGRVVRIIDLGLQPQQPYKGKEKPPVHKINVTYELGTEFMPDDDGNPDTERPRVMSESFPLYPLDADKAKSTARYLALDPKKEHGGDWSALLGLGCLVMVDKYFNKYTESETNGVGAIAGLPKGFDAPPLVNPPTIFLLDEPDMEVFNNIPEWLQETIKGNLEFRGSKLEALLSGGTLPAEEEAEEEDDQYSNIPV